MATGLEFPANGGAYVSLDWSNPPNRTLMTLIFDVYVKTSSSGYRAWWWHHHNGNGTRASDEWDFGDYNVGFHPYPGGDGSVDSDGNATDGDTGDPNQYYEIAGAGEAKDWIANAGSSTVYEVNSQFGTWVPQAITIEEIDVGGTDYIEYTYHVDRTNMSDKIVHRQLLSDLSSDYDYPLDPLLSLGASKWRQIELDENSNAIFRNIQMYSGVKLSSSDIVTEGNGTNPTTPATTDGQTYVYYRKLNPTPDDVADDSGEGNDPVWFNDVQAELWTDAVKTAVGFASDSDYLTRTTNLLNYNAAYTTMLWVKFDSFVYYGHVWAAINGSEGAGDYEDSDFMGHDNSNPGLTRAGSYNASSGSPPTGQTLAADTWYHFALVRASTSSLLLYVDGVSTPDISDTGNVASPARASVGTEIIARLNTVGIRGSVACVKQWTKALSSGGVLAEMNKNYAVDTGSLHEVWNFVEGANQLIGEINGYTWTSHGSVTAEVGPELESEVTGSPWNYYAQVA